MPQFGDMPHGEARRSVELFAKEVLPVIQQMDAPLRAATSGG